MTSASSGRGRRVSQEGFLSPTNTPWGSTGLLLPGLTEGKGVGGERKRREEEGQEKEQIYVANCTFFFSQKSSPLCETGWLLPGGANRNGSERRGGGVRGTVGGHENFSSRRDQCCKSSRHPLSNTTLGSAGLFLPRWREVREGEGEGGGKGVSGGRGGKGGGEKGP